MHAKSCSLHAIFSAHAQDNRIQYFRDRDWLVHQQQIETIPTHRGAIRTTNADNLFFFLAGMLVSRSAADVIILGTGDGRLAYDTARFIRDELKQARQVVTLSLCGSTSQFLRADDNPAIHANLELGLDCLRPLAEH